MQRHLAAALLSLAFPLTGQSSEVFPGPTPDPYRVIETITLANGTRVVLAPSPSADTFEINLSLKAGQRDDPKGKAGTAHLLEHYLFQDPSLKAGTTYLDLIKEKGGYANGITKFDETEYFATIEKVHADWLVETSSKILLNKSFIPAEVELAKKPVYLEIGQPGPFDFARVMRSPALVKFLHVPSFWEREFGIEADHGPNLRGSDRIDTRSIQAADLEKFYKDFYGPSNLTIFVAGGFDLESMKSRIKDTFGQTPDRAAHSRPEPPVTAQVRPFTAINLTTEVPRIEVGAKIADLSAEEVIIADMYLRHFAHRLMKDLRNLKGETYTVSPNFHLHQRHGYATIQFETSVDQYQQNLDFVREQMQRETQGGVTREQFEEARQLYRAKFSLNENGASSMMANAKYLAEFRETYPEAATLSPFDVFSKIHYESYSDGIKKLFRPEMAYENRTEPPALFRYDPVAFTLIAFCLWMLASRPLFARKFPHNQIQWVRKCRYFPAYMIQLATLCLGLFFVTISAGAVQKIWNGSGLSQQPALISYYAKSFVEMAVIVLSFQLSLMLVARKAMVVGDKLIVKSLGFWSYSYPLSQVQSVELMHPLRLLLSPVLLYRTGFRFFYYFDLKFWNKGILVRLKNKKCVFLCLTEPATSFRELSAFIKRDEPVLEIVKDQEAA